MDNTNIENKNEVMIDENKILLIDLVNGYAKLTTDAQRKLYLKEKLKVKKYVSYAMKYTLCKNLVNKTSFDNDGNIKIDSPSRYLFFNKTLIDCYTTIKTNDSFYEDYDLLKESGLFEVIIKHIPESETEEFKIILDMTLDDCIKNNMNAKAYITSQVNRFSKLLNIIGSPLLDTLTKKVEGLSDKDINKYINKLSNAMIKKQ